jgi:putative membrane-bound dehydrogenase-like protein
MRVLSLCFLFLLIVSCDRRDTSGDKPLLFLPDDLGATLWAESPMFYNPTNIDIDARGRIWVTEAVNYRNFNNDSTRALHHAKGDRVMILEDTDGDGKADVSKVFVQDKDLVSPLGIAVIGNKVYVSCSPDLVVYTDSDGDDRPDHKEVLLTGFGGRDHDHSLHAVVGGMDGNLYFNTGNAGPHHVTDKSGWTLRSGSMYTGGSPYNTRNEGNQKSDDGKVWVGGLALKISPTGDLLQVVAHNFRNAYELTVDSNGDLWQNDNDDQVAACRTSWLMEGGNAGYFSDDGTRSWQADQRPWQDVFTAHWHQDDPGVMPAGDNAGAGSPTGVVVNESDALGSAYRGMLFSADAGRNVVFGYHPQKQRSGYDLGERLNFITSLRKDNEGYVWNDSAHNAQSEKWFRPSDIAIGTDGALYVADWYDPVVGGHQMQDTTAYGRIYRIAPKDRRLHAPDLDLNTTEGLLEALRSPAINVRFTAMEKLRTSGQDVVPVVREMFDSPNPYHHARAVWLLSRLGPVGIREVENLLDHKNEQLRIVAFRALRRTSSDILPSAKRLVADPSPSVRREVVIALADLPFSDTKDLLLQLAGSYDGEDRWFLEALGYAVGDHASDFYKDLLKQFNVTSSDAAKWDARLASLVWRLHPPEAVDALRQRASASSLRETERSSALTALAFINTREAVKAMISLAGDQNAAVAEQARYWITFRQGNSWYALWDWRRSDIDLGFERRLAALKIKRNRILDPQMPLNEKRWAARDMSKDEEGARMLLSMVADDQVPEPLRPFVEKLFRNHGNEMLRMQASRHFVRSGPAELTVARIRELSGDVTAGKSVFDNQCAACHRVQKKGKDIGPDLTAIKTKFDREALLDAIVNPDAGIVFGYDPWTITLRDGQSHFGFLVADGAQTVTIKDLAGKSRVIDTGQIVSRKKQEGSLMPSPSALGLSGQDVADVSAYLMTLD